MKRILLVLLCLLALPASADDVQGIFYNPTLKQFQGETRANGMVGFGQTVKEYVVGTAYTNGTPNITSGLTSFSVVRAVLVPYQTSDGAWRLRMNGTFSMTATNESAAGNVFTLVTSMTISGVTFKNVGNHFQPGSALPFNGSILPSMCYVSPNSSTVNLVLMTSASSTQAGFGASFDVELDSKPTWAD